MLRAPMPEAAVDKDSNLGSRKENVSATTLPRRCSVHPISKTTPVEFSAECSFGGGVACPLALEALPNHLTNRLGS